MKTETGFRKAFSEVFPALCVLCLCFAAVDAYALTAPTAGSPYYTVYKILVTDIVEGPVGYALCTVGGIFTAGMVVMSKLPAALGAAVGTALMAGSSTIVSSLGAVIL